MHNPSRPLNLLPIVDPTLRNFPRGGANVVIEGKDIRRAGRRPNEFRALTVITLDDGSGLKKVEGIVCERSLKQLEPVPRERAATTVMNCASVPDRQRLALENHPFETAIAPVGVPV
jgi:hypothetical protein